MHKLIIVQKKELFHGTALFDFKKLLTEHNEGLPLLIFWR
jgi:hypothetical protein